MIAFFYTACTVLFGLCPGHIAASILKLLVLTYTINCLVSGTCHALGWVHVLALVIFCASDLAGLMHVDRALRASNGSPSGIFSGAGHVPYYGEARERLNRA